jgi:hypothetical protein
VFLRICGATPDPRASTHRRRTHRGRRIVSPSRARAMRARRSKHPPDFMEPCVFDASSVTLVATPCRARRLPCSSDGSPGGMSRPPTRRQPLCAEWPRECARIAGRAAAAGTPLPRWRVRRATALTTLALRGAASGLCDCRFGIFDEGRPEACRAGTARRAAQGILLDAGASCVSRALAQRGASFSRLHSVRSRPFSHSPSLRSRSAHLALEQDVPPMLHWRRERLLRSWPWPGL